MPGFYVPSPLPEVLCRAGCGGLPRGSRFAARVVVLCRSGGGALPRGCSFAARMVVGGPSLGPLGAPQEAKLNLRGKGPPPTRQRTPRAPPNAGWEDGRVEEEGPDGPYRNGGDRRGRARGARRTGTATRGARARHQHEADARPLGDGAARA